MSDYGSTPPPPPPPGGGGYSAPPPDGGGAYGGGAYGGGGQGFPVDHPKGMTVLVLGILSLVCCAPLGIVAWVMGNGVLREIDAQPGRYGNRQLVQVGRILGIVGTVLLVLGVLWFVVVLAFGLIPFTTSP
ncbi:MAG TPA: DUF4190 domain-containing protein [Ornithinibacter sp.]|nr:DUF4190 domain-containing protein [Ornithinibacter sp.]